MKYLLILLSLMGCSVPLKKVEISIPASLVKEIYNIPQKETDSLLQPITFSYETKWYANDIDFSISRTSKGLESIQLHSISDPEIAARVAIDQRQKIEEITQSVMSLVVQALAAQNPIKIQQPSENPLKENK